MNSLSSNTAATSARLSPETPTKTSIVEAAAEQLHAMIVDGQMPVGAALPPQRELARKLKLSRASLREALSRLAARGVLSMEQGRGTFVRSREAVDLTNLDWPYADRYSPAEVFQFRYIAESHAAQIAATLCTPSDIERMHDNLADFRKAVRTLDLTAFAQVDFEFHQMIMGFSRNRILIDAHRNFRMVLSESQRLPLQKRDELWEAVYEHERILEAFTMSDPVGAAYYMRQHLSRAADRAGVTFTELR